MNLGNGFSNPPTSAAALDPILGDRNPLAERLGLEVPRAKRRDLEGLEPLLTIPETAKILAVSERTVWDYIKKDLKVVRLGKKAVRVCPSDLKKFIEARKVGGE